MAGLQLAHQHFTTSCCSQWKWCACGHVQPSVGSILIIQSWFYLLSFHFLRQRTSVVATSPAPDKLQVTH